MPKIIEIACFSLEAALIAQAAGANRIEFCIDKSQGGISPSFALMQAVRAAIHIPLYMMIRPRGGDFVYNTTELVQMSAMIVWAKELGINGFVFGILNSDNTINLAENQALVQLAAPLPCTFHRAFDGILDKKIALNQLIDMGFQCLLTAGGEGNALYFLPELSALIKQAQNKIGVMPGGGIRSSNLAQIQAATNAEAYHSAGIITGDLPDAAEIKQLIALHFA